MFSTQNQNLEIYNSCRMTQNLDNIVKVFSSTINDFLFINWVLFSFGMMNIGLSFSINSDNIDGKYVSISFLYLGLILCLPSLNFYSGRKNLLFSALQYRIPHYLHWCAVSGKLNVIKIIIFTRQSEEPGC